MSQYTAVGSVTPIYDGRGNLTFDGTNTYAYDTENRLVSATVPGHSIAYSYDPEGRLGQETVDSGTPLSFYYDGLVPMSDITNALFGSGGGQIHRQVFGAGDAPLYLLVSGVRSYAYQDGLGSVIALANGTASPAGALAGSYGYDAYGQTSTPTGPVFRYAGQRFDSLTGLVYDNARFYSPGLGRFLQPDPIGYAGGNNLYAYAGNGPVNLTDPSGLLVNQLGNAANQLIQNHPQAIGTALVVAGGALVLTGVGSPEGLALASAGGTVLAGGVVVDATAGVGAAAVAAGTVLMNQNQGDQGGSNTGSSVDPNKLNHIFGNPGHNLEPVVSEFGSQEGAFSAIQNAAQQAVRNQGIQGSFETQVQVGTQTVTVRGVSSGGITRIGTAFIP